MSATIQLWVPKFGKMVTVNADDAEQWRTLHGATDAPPAEPKPAGGKGGKQDAKTDTKTVTAPADAPDPADAAGGSAASTATDAPPAEPKPAGGKGGSKATG